MTVAILRHDDAILTHDGATLRHDVAARQKRMGRFGSRTAVGMVGRRQQRHRRTGQKLKKTWHEMPQATIPANSNKSPRPQRLVCLHVCRAHPDRWLACIHVLPPTQKRRPSSSVCQFTLGLALPKLLNRGLWWGQGATGRSAALYL